MSETPKKGYSQKPGTMMDLAPLVSGAQDLIDRMRDRIAEVLPKHVTPETMIRLFRVMISRRPKLATCTRETLLASIIDAAVLGFEPDTPEGLCWILPYENRKRSIVEAQLIIGYRGFIRLAYQGGLVSAVNAECVYAGDELEIDYGTARRLVHRPKFVGERGPIIGAYAIFQLTGGQVWRYLPDKEILDRKRKSPAANSSYSPWNVPESTPAMYRKSAIRACVPFVPTSREMRRATDHQWRAEEGKPQRFLAREVAPEIFGELEAIEEVAEDEAPKTLGEHVTKVANAAVAAKPSAKEDLVGKIREGIRRDLGADTKEGGTDGQ